jgi:hypothetical protein
MLSKQLDLDGLVKISNQCMGQLHFISEASNVVVISRVQHHDCSSFSGLAWEVAVLQLLHLIILFMSQHGQSFSHNITHTFIATSLNCRHLVDDHRHMP